jgi:hypothetical protein
LEETLVTAAKYDETISMRNNAYRVKRRKAPGATKERPRGFIRGRMQFINSTFVSVAQLIFMRFFLFFWTVALFTN